MAELGELEKHHQEFEKRNVRVVVISNDDAKTAAATQADFPHLLVVSDAEQTMAKAIGVLHPGTLGGTDTNAPTTFILSGTGTVRWFFRPERFIARLSPDELLAAVDENGP